MERIVIIGAGLVGSVLASYLARAGYRVVVYERAPDPRFEAINSGRSVGIVVTVRGFRALDAIGVGDQVRARCIPIYGRMIHHPDAALTYQAYGARQEANYAITRAELSLLLLEHAEQHPEVTIYFNEKCVDVDVTTCTVQLLNTKTGNLHEVKGSRLFGADGAYSAVRQAMQRRRRFNFSQEYSEIGYREIAVPAPGGGALPFQVNAFHLWPRNEFVLLGFFNQSGGLTLTLMLRHEGAVSFDALSSVSALPRFFREHFVDVSAFVEPLLPEVVKRPVEPLLTIKCSPWVVEGRVTLIGDACHAILPFYGQGANAGFEDCHVLMQLLEQHEGCWRSALEEYQLQRKPNTDAIADLCQVHARELMEKVAEPDFHLRKRLEVLLQELVPGYMSLYHNISFTCMPYAEAVRQEQLYSAVIDDLMQIEGIDAKLSTEERAFWQTQMERALNRRAAR
jgi:kynurenine 3-monooxygenase